MQGHIKPPKVSKGPMSQTMPTCAPILNSAGYRPSSACAGTRVVGGWGVERAASPAHRRFALTLVLGTPRSYSSMGDKMRRDRCLLLRGVFAQHDEMRLLPGKEETRLSTCLWQP